MANKFSLQYDEEELQLLEEDRLDTMVAYLEEPDIEFETVIDAPNYVVTNFGEVISITGSEPKVLKPWTLNGGHKEVGITNGNGVRERRLVHRMVAQAFIRNPDNLPVVRHLDDNPAHNSVKNLAWGTYKDNTHDCINHNRDYHKPVYCYETNAVYRSGAQAARELGCDKSAISQACTGKTGTAGGYHVCFVEDKEEKMGNLAEWMKVDHHYKPLHAKNLKTGEELYFESRKEASEKLEIPGCGISSVVNGHLRHTHGWYFWED